MKAIVHTGAETVQVEERDRPTPNDDEVLVKVHTAGICGSDAHAYLLKGGYEWIQIPRIMGHEYSGEVEAVGANVTEFEPGEKVVEEPIHDCGVCFQCRNGQANVCKQFSITGMHTNGAFADYTTVESRHLHRIPPSVPLRHAAITEPLSIATRAVITRSETRPGSNVLVMGPGPIGVFIAVIAQSMGANVTVSGIERDAEHRLPFVEELGMATIDVSRDDLETTTDARTDGIGFDVAFDTTGHKSGLEMGADVVRKGGQIVVVGLPGQSSDLFMTPVVRGEIGINTSYGSTWRNFEQALRLMENGAIDPDAIIDTSYSISDPATAFDAFLNSETCKPVFSFHDDGSDGL